MNLDPKNRAPKDETSAGMTGRLGVIYSSFSWICLRGCDSTIFEYVHLETG